MPSDLHDPRFTPYTLTYLPIRTFSRRLDSVSSGREPRAIRRNAVQGSRASLTYRGHPHLQGAPSPTGGTLTSSLDTHLSPHAVPEAGPQ